MSDYELCERSNENKFVRPVVWLKVYLKSDLE